MTSEGPIVVYRNRSDDEIRDIYVSRLVADKRTTGTAIHNDGWQIKACPINGPVVSAHGREVAVAWHTMKNEIGQAFVAFSSDAEKTFGQPMRLARQADQLVFAWTETPERGGTGQVKIATAALPH